MMFIPTQPLAVLLALLVACPEGSGETSLALCGADCLRALSLSELRLGVDYSAFPASGMGEILGAEVYVMDLFACESGVSRYAKQMDLGMQSGRRRRVGLVRRGQCSFQEKLDYSHAIGLDALLVFNQGDTEDRYGLLEQAHITENYGMPVFFLSHEAGLRVRAHTGRINLVYTIDMMCPWLDTDVHETTKAMQRHEVPGDETANVTLAVLNMLQRVPVAEAFYEAALRGETALLESLYRADPLAVLGRHGEQNETALHAAARMGHCGTARRLAMMGSPLDVVDGNNLTPLVSAVLANMQCSTRALLEVGVSVNSSDASEDALYYACKTQAALCDMLLQWGASPDVVFTGRGETTLHAAMRTGKVGSVRTLLRWGADTTIPTSSGRLPEALATAHPTVRALFHAHTHPKEHDLPLLEADSALVMLITMILRAKVRNRVYSFMFGVVVVVQAAVDPGMVFPTSAMFIFYVTRVLKVNTVFFCLCLLCFGFMLFVKWWDCFSLFGVPDLTEEYQLLFTDIREIVTLLLEGDDYEL